MVPIRAIGFEIKSISNLIRRQIGKNTMMAKAEILTGMHGWIIGYLFENKDKDVFQRDFEVEFQIRRSTATGMLQRMEKNGLIIRTEVPWDARLKKLSLTQKAIDLHEKVMFEIDRLERTLAQGLTQDEIDTFFIIMAKLKKNIE